LLSQEIGGIREGIEVVLENMDLEFVRNLAEMKDRKKEQSSNQRLWDNVQVLPALHTF
jgi:hypothetical protein